MQSRGCLEVKQYNQIYEGNLTQVRFQVSAP